MKQKLKLTKSKSIKPITKKKSITKQISKETSKEVTNSKEIGNLQSIAKEVFTLNKAKNTADRAYNTKRKSLLAEMDATGLESIEVPVEGKKNLIAQISTVKKSVIDIDKLRDAVSEEIFNKCIKTDITTVVQFAGKDTQMRCTSTEDGTRNVSVKEEKA